jgi:hypothetical protein
VSSVTARIFVPVSDVSSSVQSGARHETGPNATRLRGR